MLLRRASPKRQNLSLPNGYSFSSNALTDATRKKFVSIFANSATKK
jgi:hypothetical protein